MRLSFASRFGHLIVPISPEKGRFSLTLLFVEEVREKRSNGRHIGGALICDAAQPMGELMAPVVWGGGDWRCFDIDWQGCPCNNNSCDTRFAAPCSSPCAWKSRAVLAGECCVIAGNGAVTAWEIGMKLLSLGVMANVYLSETWKTSGLS